MHHSRTANTNSTAPQSRSQAPHGPAATLLQDEPTAIALNVGGQLRASHAPLPTGLPRLSSIPVTVRRPALPHQARVRAPFVPCACPEPVAPAGLRPVPSATTARPSSILAERRAELWEQLRVRRINAALGKVGLALPSTREVPPADRTPSINPYNA
ncbi:hypothetical protein V7S43_015335 [Phytophthora oleae]|uniref:Uncharacterized protein n=1 Tax=Phytophthora oleae TaxID=2107226 RepID=A0ABD3F0P1_9STRA